MEDFFPFHFFMRRTRDILNNKTSKSQFVLLHAAKVSSKMGEARITHKKVTQIVPCSPDGRILEVAGEKWCEFGAFLHLHATEPSATPYALSTSSSVVFDAAIAASCYTVA